MKLVCSNSMEVSNFNDRFKETWKSQIPFFILSNGDNRNGNDKDMPDRPKKIQQEEEEEEEKEEEKEETQSEEQSES